MKQVDSLVGLQWGSEGKGKIAGVLAHFYDAAVRTGAPNAGHTVEYNGKKYVMRSIPCGFGNPATKLFVGPGGLINLEVLAKELEQFPDGGKEILSRLYFDRNAGVISHADIEEEETVSMNSKNGSTAEGVGVAQAKKVLRRGDFQRIGATFNEPLFNERVTDVAMLLNSILNNGGAIMLEGTQGFGLCMNHGDYPFTTSRDVTAAALLSDAGLPPKSSRFVFGVMRTYPIRVAGNSGPMGDGRELSWADVSARCGAPEGAIVEKTTVTKRVRRVSEIDWAFMKRSAAINGPDGIFVNFIDYLDWSMHGATEWSQLTAPGRVFIDKIESTLGVPVLGVSTGAGERDMIWTPTWHNKFEGVMAEGRLSLV